MEHSRIGDFFGGLALAIGLWALLWWMLLELPRLGGLWYGAVLVAIVALSAWAVARKRAYFAVGLIGMAVAPVLAVFACARLGGWG